MWAVWGGESGFYVVLAPLRFLGDVMCKPLGCTCSSCDLHVSIMCCASGQSDDDDDDGSTRGLDRMDSEEVLARLTGSTSLHDRPPSHANSLELALEDEQVGGLQ